MSDPKDGLSRDVMDQTASIAAQKNAMDRGGKFLPHGGRLYAVEQGWESTMIARDNKVATADTLLTLEQALRDPENRIIFIPLGALMTDADIERLCQRNGVPRTLYKEVKKA